MDRNSGKFCDSIKARDEGDLERPVTGGDGASADTIPLLSDQTPTLLLGSSSGYRGYSPVPYPLPTPSTRIVLLILIIHFGFYQT